MMASSSQVLEGYTAVEELIATLNGSERERDLY